MKGHSIKVLLADDDVDDCLLFEDALAELPISTKLSTVNDGEQLIRRLFEDKDLPEVLFLDLNMPRRNGYECLVDIKTNEKTREVPVIIISTSYNPEVVRLLHEGGAGYYIRKPEEFESLKSVINKGLSLLTSGQEQVTFNDFVLNP